MFGGVWRGAQGLGEFVLVRTSSILPLGLAVAEGALRRLKTQSSLPSSLQVLRVEFLASLAAGMLFASTSELVPKPIATAMRVTEPPNPSHRGSILLPPGKN